MESIDLDLPFGLSLGLTPEITLTTSCSTSVVKTVNKKHNYLYKLPALDSTKYTKKVNTKL